MKIEISDSWKEYVERRTAESGLDNPATYVEHMLQTEAEFDRALGSIDPVAIAGVLREAAASGPPVPMTDEYWDEIDRAAMAEIAARTTGGTRKA